MGTVIRKQWTAPLPAGATIVTKAGRKVAKWVTTGGKQRSAEVIEGADGTPRIRQKSRTWFAKYRDATGVVRIVPTGCKDERAARQRLAELERTGERIRAGIATEAEADAASRKAEPFALHLAKYLERLDATDAHRAERRRQLGRLAAELRWRVMGDLKREPLHDWLTDRGRGGMAPRTRNTYLSAALAFANWAAAQHLLAENPFEGIPKADERTDTRRRRRALTEGEIRKLLDAAARRPLEDAMTVRRGASKGKPLAKLRPATAARLERVGRERALIYKTLILTGLRRGELASLTVGQLDLESAPACIELEARDAKNGKAATIPLRSDLAADLRDWLALRLAEERTKARKAGRPVPMRLDPSLTILDVPDKLCKILSRDLAAAGIPKFDDRGRVIDVHALRHSFGTLLSRAGVAPRTAQAAMRHAKIDLTMNTYTDPRLLDVAGAVEALPVIPLALPDRREQATGTAGPLAPVLAPAADTAGHTLATQGNFAGYDDFADDGPTVAVTSFPGNGKGPLTTPVNGPGGVGVIGLEPMTPSLSSGGRSVETPTILGNFDTPAVACTSACTSVAAAPAVDALAAALLALPEADRTRLAALLAAQPGRPTGGQE